MAMSYRRVSVLLPVPPYNQNSAFILEKNHVKKKYVKNLELINKDLKKSTIKQGIEMTNPAHAANFERGWVEPWPWWVIPGIGRVWQNLPCFTDPSRADFRQQAQ